MPKERQQRDPLESRLLATLFFGGVFLAAFVINAFQALTGMRPLPISVGGEGKPLPTAAFAAGWLFFAAGTGFSVATTRRAIKRMPRKNFASGLVVGAWYTGSCVLLFAGAIPFGVGWFALVVGVFVGVAYAVTSGLNEVFRD
jgi:hypothetical protein